MSARPRVLIFSTAYEPFIGGAEIAIKEITNKLDDYDFDLITPRFKRSLPKKETIGRVNVYRVGWGSNFDKWWLAFWGHKLASQLHKKNNYQIMWAMMASFGGLSAVRFKRKNESVPLLLTLQEGDDLVKLEGKVKILGRWWRDIFNLADHVQCISGYLAQWAKKQGVPEDKISIVPNGVDIDKFYFKNEEYNGEEVRLVTTSRLVYKNGLDLVIRALPLLPANIKFYIAGTGPEENSLKSLAKDLKVVDKIKWLGFIEYDKLPELLHQSTIFVRPSRTEGLGNSFLEAMSCGVSVVATCVGGIADFLVDRETGFVCQSENPQSIADSIKFIVGKDNQDLVAEVRQGAREMVEERYSWKHVTGQMDNIFESLL